MEIKIDLKNVFSEDEVLQTMGEALGYTGDKFWGKNWNAFKDILGYLDTGGINGDNEIFPMPVALLIENFQEFKSQAPEDFTIFEDILNITKNENKEFDFKFI